jgi:Rrf2 family nitric oxide-sensitive transcriptional repressor
MQLTKHTDYAFRILLFLLTLPAGKKATIHAIAERYGISKSHVMKIVNKLAASGFIHATRGKSGGISLGKAPEQIKLDAIVRLMETSLQPVNCKEPICILAGHCKLARHLQQASEAFTSYLSQVSLADLADPNSFEILRRNP